MKPKFLAQYKKAAKAGLKGQLIGERLLLEVIEGAATDDGLSKTKGGIYIAESDHVRSDFVMLKSTVAIVLEVGSGYYDPDTGKDVPLETKVGSVVWVPAQSLTYLTTVPGHGTALPEKVLALGSEGQIIKRWDTVKDYEADKAILDI